MSPCVTLAPRLDRFGPRLAPFCDARALIGPLLGPFWPPFWPLFRCCDAPWQAFACSRFQAGAMRLLGHSRPSMSRASKCFAGHSAAPQAGPAGPGFQMSWCALCCAPGRAAPPVLQPGFLAGICPVQLVSARYLPGISPVFQLVSAASCAATTHLTSCGMLSHVAACGIWWHTLTLCERAAYGGTH